MNTNCKLCGCEMPLPSMDWNGSPESRGYSSEYSCPECGARYFIDQTTNQFTGESFNTPENNYIEFEGRTFELNGEERTNLKKELS